MDVGKKEYEIVVITEKTERKGLYQITMKTATHFFLDISIEFVQASIKKIAENHFSFSLNIILDPHSKNQSKINGKVIDLMLAMAYNNELHYRKSSMKNIPALEIKPNLSAIDAEGRPKAKHSTYSQSMRLEL